jgi:phasin family protein
MATPTDPFTAFSAMLEQFKLPGVDMSAVIEARRKDIEALTQANQVAYAGMQALVQKQTDILRKSMEEMQAAAQQMAARGNPAENFAKQGEFVQKTLQKTFENMRELAEMARKSQAEALEAINQRAQQNMQEIKAMMQPK